MCVWLLFWVAFACCLLLLFPETPSVSFHSFSCVGMDNRYKWIDDRLSSERVRQCQKKTNGEYVVGLHQVGEGKAIRELTLRHMR